MKDERITIETAKLLKTKNFDIFVDSCFIEYLKNKKDSEYPEGGGPFSMTKGEIEIDYCAFKNGFGGTDLTNKNYVMYARPTQSRVARWLREIHNIQVYSYSNTKNGDGVYRDYVVHVNEKSINDARDEEFQTYEEGMEVGLQVALEMI
jgi:hypothetical protein